VAAAVASASMLGARRRLLARLHWAVELGPGRTPSDGTLVLGEVEPRTIVPPPGGADKDRLLPWVRRDLTVSAGGEAGRISLDHALVDDQAARALVRLALGLPGRASFTVLGHAHRAPADPVGAAPLDRIAPTQVRIGDGPLGRPVLC